MRRYVVSDPDILGGKPVIKGTRIPVDQILFLLKEGYTIEAIHEYYPHVDIKTITGTVDEVIKLINNNASQIL